MKVINYVYKFVFFPFRLLRSFFYDVEKDPILLFLVAILVITILVCVETTLLISPLEKCKETFNHEESFCSDILTKCYLHENDKTDRFVIQDYVKCQSRMSASTCDSIFFDCEKLK